ncbi:uncharacterized protein LOC135143427 [Zophobas morio]|uniref:uncharacterized protein LOC135143427 n=1 Tax=Zophobas morio TaxID=2755281 RepID=UPI003082AEE0
MVVDHLVPLLKDIFGDSKILQDVRLARTKCSEVVNNVVSKHETNVLVKNLKNNNFSVLVDESTDISNHKNLCVLVKYCDNDDNKTKTNLLELVPLDAKDCSAENLYNAFKDCLYKHNIPLTNIIGIACDGANVMTGHTNSFFSRLQDDIPHVVLMKCVCHSAALVASKACEKLPRGPEDLIRNIGSYITGSAKRCAILVEFQTYFHQEQKKILKLATTRWLSRHQCVVRILDNWTSLEHFFVTAAAEDKLRCAETILKDMRDVYTKAYLYFLKYALNFLNAFNALFQSNAIIIHQLQDNCNRLLLQLCSNYLKTEVCYCKDLSAINLAHPEYFVELKNIKLGAACESYLQSAPLAVQETVRKYCLSFYVTAGSEIQQRLPISNSIFKSMKFMDPEIIFSPTRHSEIQLTPLVNQFKSLIDETQLSVEWQNLPSSFNEQERKDLKVMPLDKMWLEIANAKNFDNILMFPNIGKLAKVILTLPHSNAEAERIFSLVTDIKSKKRNRMGEITLNAMCVIRSALHQSNKTCVNYAIVNDMLKLYSNFYSFKE